MRRLFDLNTYWTIFEFVSRVESYQCQISWSGRHKPVLDEWQIFFLEFSVSLSIKMYGSIKILIYRLLYNSQVLSLSELNCMKHLTYRTLEKILFILIFLPPWNLPLIISFQFYSRFDKLPFTRNS